MYDLIKARAKRSPYFLLDSNKGLIELKGSSLMEDAKAFYEPMMAWAFEYIKSPQDTVVNIDLEYFNGASARILVAFFKTISSIRENGYSLEVNWFYDEDEPDIRDSGYNFSNLLKLDFHLIEKKKDSFSNQQKIKYLPKCTA